MLAPHFPPQKEKKKRRSGTIGKREKKREGKVVWGAVNLHAVINETKIY